MTTNTNIIVTPESSRQAAPVLNGVEAIEAATNATTELVNTAPVIDVTKVINNNKETTSVSHVLQEEVTNQPTKSVKKEIIKSANFDHDELRNRVKGFKNFARVACFTKNNASIDNFKKGRSKKLQSSYLDPMAASVGYNHLEIVVSDKTLSKIEEMLIADNSAMIEAVVAKCEEDLHATDAKKEKVKKIKEEAKAKKEEAKKAKIEARIEMTRKIEEPDEIKVTVPEMPVIDINSLVAE